MKTPQTSSAAIVACLGVGLMAGCGKPSYNLEGVSSRSITAASDNSQATGVSNVTVGKKWIELRNAPTFLSSPQVNIQASGDVTTSGSEVAFISGGRGQSKKLSSTTLPPGARLVWVSESQAWALQGNRITFLDPVPADAALFLAEGNNAEAASVDLPKGTEGLQPLLSSKTTLLLEDEESVHAIFSQDNKLLSHSVTKSELQIVSPIIGASASDDGQTLQVVTWNKRLEVSLGAAEPTVITLTAAPLPQEGETTRVHFQFEGSDGRWTHAIAVVGKEILMSPSMAATWGCSAAEEVCNSPIDTKQFSSNRPVVTVAKEAGEPAPTTEPAATEPTADPNAPPEQMVNNGTDPAQAADPAAPPADTPPTADAPPPPAFAFTWQADILPIAQAACASCHGNGLALGGWGQALQEQSWQGARTARLLERLESTDPNRVMPRDRVNSTTRADYMNTLHASGLTQRQVLIEWLKSM